MPQVFTCVKSPVLVMLLMVSGTCPVLVRVTVCVAADEKPTAWFAKVRLWLIGEIVTIGKLAPRTLVTKASPFPALALLPSTVLPGTATGTNGKSYELVLPARYISPFPVGLRAIAFAWSPPEPPR